MGIAITLAFSLGICMLALLTRRIVVLYTLTIIWIAFIETGQGGSEAGSIFYNQGFLNFFKFKFIEILTVITYTFTLLTVRNKTPSLFRFEKWLLLAYLSWVLILLVTEYAKHDTISVSGWRPILTAILYFHMMAIYLNSSEKVMTFVKVMLILMGLCAFIYMALYLAGFGTHGPRGYVPETWDTRQVELFTIAMIMLTAYIANFKYLPAKYRILPRTLSIVILALCSILVLLCFRRSQWAIGFIGIIMALYMYGKLRIQHIIGLILGGIVIVGLIMIMPGLDDLRDRYAFYINSLNILDEEVAAIDSNKIHINAVEDFYNIIRNSPEMLLFGYRGREGDNYTEFVGTGFYTLGSAHNSIIHAIQFFGLPGLIIFTLFYTNIFIRYRQVSRLPNNSPTKFIAVGALVFLIAALLPTLAFSSAFFNQIKSSTYTLAMLFLLRTSIYYAILYSDETEEKHSSAKHASNRLLSTVKIAPHGIRQNFIN